MIRLLVADDHAVVRKGIAQILSEQGHIRIIGEATSGRDVVRMARELAFEVLILDLSMPDGGGLEVLSRVLAFRPGLRVLVLSMHSAKPYVLRALKAGAAGYLTKESAPDELVAAVNRIAAGGRFVSQAVSDVLIQGLMDETTRPPHERLSDREDRVMRMLAEGKTVTQIAADLSLSVKTISTYRSRILEKLGLKTTADLIRYAVHQGLSL